MQLPDNQCFYASRAIARVKNAIEKGLLVRPESCELCGRIPQRIKREPIQAHHWNSYRNPTDVLFVCGSCNQKLAQPVFHCGLFDKEQSRQLISMSSEMRNAIAKSYSRKHKALIDRLIWNIVPGDESETLP